MVWGELNLTCRLTIAEKFNMLGKVSEQGFSLKDSFGKMIANRFCKAVKTSAEIIRNKR